MAPRSRDALRTPGSARRLLRRAGRTDACEGALGRREITAGAADKRLARVRQLPAERPKGNAADDALAVWSHQPSPRRHCTTFMDATKQVTLMDTVSCESELLRPNLPRSIDRCTVWIAVQKHSL